jgi:hypothetical protein
MMVPGTILERSAAFGRGRVAVIARPVSLITNFITYWVKYMRMVLSIRDTTTTLALNLIFRKAGNAEIQAPAAAPIRSSRGMMIKEGTPSPRVKDTQVIMHPEKMKIPSPERLNLFTACIKHIHRPVKISGVARATISPMRLRRSKGPTIKWRMATRGSVLIREIIMREIR